MQDVLCCAGLLVALGDPPTSINNAQQRDDWLSWKAAAIKECAQMDKYSVYDGVDLADIPTQYLPPVPSKFVFKHVLDAEGLIIGHKVRLCLRGDRERPGQDYFPDEISAPVASLVTTRTMLSAAAVRGWYASLSDISGAFLQGKPITQTVYMAMPKGAIEAGLVSHSVVRLKKCLYGAHSAPALWNQQFNSDLISVLGMVRSKYDICLYSKNLGTDQALMCTIVVDDVTTVSPHQHLIDAFEDKLTSLYSLSERGPLHQLLGMKVVYSQSDRFVVFSQPGTITNMVKRFGLMDQHRVTIPMRPDFVPNFELNTTPPLSLDLMKQYQAKLGCGIWTAISTRPDISQPINVLARHMKTPNHHHMAALNQVYAYLQSTKDIGICFHYDHSKPHNVNTISIYTDATWGTPGRVPNSRWGVVIKMNNGPILWNSLLMKVIAQSSCESEFMGMSNSCRKLAFLLHISPDLDIPQTLPLIMHEDNTSSIQMSKNQANGERTRHILMRYQYVRDMVEQGIIKPQFCGTNDMEADMLTKALPAPQFIRLRDLLMGKLPPHLQKKLDIRNGL
jgi:hypothetical protein